MDQIGEVAGSGSVTDSVVCGVVAAERRSRFSLRHMWYEGGMERGVGCADSKCTVYRKRCRIQGAYCSNTRTDVYVVWWGDGGGGMQ